MGKGKPSNLLEAVLPESIPINSKERRTRNQTACDACHFHHASCDSVFPCSRCLRRKIQCRFTRERRKRGRIPRQSVEDKSACLEEKETPADLGATPSSTVSSAAFSVRTPEDSQQTFDSVNNVSVLPCTSSNGPLSLEDMTWSTHARGGKVDVMEDLLDFNSILKQTGLDDSSLSFDLLNTADFARYEAPTLSCLEHERVTGNAPQGTTPLKYPVLLPLIPFIQPVLSPQQACDLLDVYFASASYPHMHPVCHQVHCYVLRKASFLSERNPRPSSPALLASMLWMAALNDRVLSLHIFPHYRKKIYHFLSSLTLRLLKPPTHAPSGSHDESTPNEYLWNPPGIAHFSAAGVQEHGFECRAGSLDDVLTYIHIASIISASEQKAASMRWWYAGFTLARELKLNREVEVLPSMDSLSKEYTASMDSFLHYSCSTNQNLNCVCYQNSDSTTRITEEQREERRRVWWLLYIMDRHLALCCNRPLILLDSESKDLLLPLDEEAWQAGEIHSNSPDFTGPQCLISGNRNIRRRFPEFTCHDPSIFGFFLPLMVIMGQVIDLNQAKDHPFLGAGLVGKEAWNAQIHQIRHQLGIYEASISAFTARATDPECLPSEPNQSTTSFSRETNLWLVQTVASYASYYVHILYILLNGRWDPISVIEDKDFFTSTPNFASTLSHALNAANAVKQILKFDPDVSLMPDFFGIQLFQGSFYFLLIVERLQDKAGESFLSAFEVIIRATESYIVTLNTGYHRNFCQIMRSAVAQARGRPVNHCDIRQRHRALLALYRWTETGNGLAF